MTLEEIQLAIRRDLDDPVSDYYDSALLADFIQEAYERVVEYVDGAHGHINIHADPVELSVTSAAQEYTIIPAGGESIRTIVSVDRVSVPTGPLTIVDFARRFDPVFRTRDGMARRVYLYRTSGGTWTLGMLRDAPATQTIHVRFTPELETITPGNEPAQVPRDHHRLIAVLASIMAGDQRRRDTSQLVQRYALGLDRMRRHLRGLPGATTVTRF